MIKCYQYLELALLTLLFFRFVVARIKGYRFEFKSIEIFLFFLTWYIHSIIVWISPNSYLAFYFVHCTFPIVISGAVIFKSRPIVLSISLIFSIYLNLFFHNQIVIELTYLITYILILMRINKLSISSNKSRRLLSVYITVLVTLILTHMIYMFGNIDVKWNQSLYADYFLYFVIFIYLASLTQIHAQFRRFLTN
jgi:hypothetical protein